jgi:hypothetical protein
MSSPIEPEPNLPLPACPICTGRMELVYYRQTQAVCVCVDCRTGLTIPATAWDVAKESRESR